MNKNWRDHITDVEARNIAVYAKKRMDSYHDVRDDIKEFNKEVRKLRRLYEKFSSHEKSKVNCLPDEIELYESSGSKKHIPRSKTIVMNRFCGIIASEYEKRTGYKATLSVDSYKNNTPTYSQGDFDSFLRFCADCAELIPDKVVSSYKSLKENR